MSDLAHPSIDVQIVPRVRDSGGFAVQRVLPSARRKMVGPFIFLDRIWWNFVSSSVERIEQARADWMAGRFTPVPGEVERIDAPAWVGRLLA